MRITHGMVHRHVLSDLNRASAQVTKLQEQMSSGLQRAAASDDPAAAARSSRLTSAVAGTRDLQRSVADAQSWTDASETALSSMTDVVKRARELLVGAGSDTSTPASRAAAAAEIDQLAESLKDQGNAAVGGRYIFGGTVTTTPPYATATADAYQGDGGTVAREVGTGTSVAINLRASDLLGSGGSDGKLLATMRLIASHMRSGDGASLRGSDLAALDAGGDTVLSARALNGATTRRLDATAEQLISFEEQTMKALSTLDDVDYGAASADFASRYTAYQAAIKTGASIVQSSLMDFLR